MRLGCEGESAIQPQFLLQPSKDLPLSEYMIAGVYKRFLLTPNSVPIRIRRGFTLSVVEDFPCRTISAQKDFDSRS